MDWRQKFKNPYFLRWFSDAEIFMCHVELDSLQMCIPHAFDALYYEDHDEPSFENLYIGSILREIHAFLIRINKQKKFLCKPEEHLNPVKLPLAYLPVLHFLITTTKQHHLVRLRGNIETVLERSGYEFEEVKKVTDYEAFVEDVKRLQSEIDEINNANA